MYRSRRSEIEESKFNLDFFIDSYKQMSLLELNEVSEKDCNILEDYITKSYKAKEALQFVKNMRWYIFHSNRDIRPADLSSTLNGDYQFRAINDICDIVLKME